MKATEVHVKHFTYFREHLLEKVTYQSSLLICRLAGQSSQLFHFNSYVKE